MTSPDLSIAQALCEIVSGLGIVPTTTLSSPTLVNGTQVPVASASHFTTGGRLDFWDGTNELSWAVKSVDYGNNVVTIDTAGRPSSGLVAPHAINVLISTNLMSFEPVRIGAMLASGDPVVFAYAMSDASEVIAEHRLGPILTFAIEERRSILRSQENPIDDNDWVAQQQSATRSDLQAILNAIATNRHLVTSQGQHALTLGRGTGPDFQRAWGRLVVKADNDQFVGVLQVVVKGLPQTF